MYSPNNFDVIVVGISGGKDSTALLLHLVFESGISRDRILPVFMDTGNEDPLTYAYVDLLAGVVGPIVRIVPPRNFWELAAHKQRFPGVKSRFCTQLLKIHPSQFFGAQLADLGVNSAKAVGVRNAEGAASNDRGSAEEWDHDCFVLPGDPERRPYVLPIWRPIVSWSDDQVWAIHRRCIDFDQWLAMLQADPKLSADHKRLIADKARDRGNLPANPLYFMGAARVGCFPCIMSRKQEIRAMARFRPERIEEIEREEERIDSTFFGPRFVPDSHKSKKVLVSDGRIVGVPTIRDVVRWSRTRRGGRQYEFDFDLYDDAGSACRVGGHCE